mmetsp:Transcript_83708/g.270885  ORF Transcript_83708/g.270885 Transcript_83708/m.270885 type:complete len:246 (+) Transcript_83708:761-1498(+)
MALNRRLMMRLLKLSSSRSRRALPNSSLSISPSQLRSNRRNTSVAREWALDASSPSASPGSPASAAAAGAKAGDSRASSQRSPLVESQASSSCSCMRPSPLVSMALKRRWTLWRSSQLSSSKRRMASLNSSGSMTPSPLRSSRRNCSLWSCRAGAAWSALVGLGSRGASSASPAGQSAKTLDSRASSQGSPLLPSHTTSSSIWMRPSPFVSMTLKKRLTSRRSSQLSWSCCRSARSNTPRSITPS